MPNSRIWKPPSLPTPCGLSGNPAFQNWFASCFQPYLPSWQDSVAWLMLAQFCCSHMFSQHCHCFLSSMLLSRLGKGSHRPAATVLSNSPTTDWAGPVRVVKHCSLLTSPTTVLSFTHNWFECCQYALRTVSILNIEVPEPSVRQSQLQLALPCFSSSAGYTQQHMHGVSHESAL